MATSEEPLIVITGGAGFIGSGVVSHLNSMGKENIVVVDDLGRGGKWQNLVGKRFVDIISRHALFSWLEGKQEQLGAIIHLGACSSTVEANADYLLDNNYRFSIRLADYALRYSLRFIYASSAATYGDGSLGFSDDHALIGQLKPLNMYGYSKQLFDLWVQSQGLLDQFVGIKYFNVFGPNEAHKGRMASAVHHFFPMVQKEGVVRLFQSEFPADFPHGGQMRDFIYVKDAVAITCAFLGNKIGGIFNVGSGTASTWNQLVYALFAALGMPAHIEYIPMPADLVGKYQNYTCAPMGKLQQALNAAYISARPLDATIADYVHNYLMLDRRW